MTSLKSICLFALSGAVVHGIPTGSGGHPVKRQDTEVCMTEACKEIGAILKRYTTAVADPDVCKGMDTFICSAYREERLKPGETEVATRYDQSDFAREVVQHYFEADSPPIDTPEDRRMFEIIKTAYEACGSAVPAAKASFAPMTEILNKMESLFKLDSASYRNPNSTKMSLEDVDDFVDLFQYVLELGDINLEVFWAIHPGIAEDDRRVRTVDIIPGVTQIPRGIFQSATTIAQYTSMLAQAITDAHPNLDARENALQLARITIEFHQRTNDIISKAAQSEPEPKIFSLDEATEWVPILGLKELIPRLLPTGADKNKIQISYRDAVRNIGELIMEISKETILIWAMWHVLMFYATDIYSTENEPVRRFLEYIGQGRSRSSPQKSYCFEALSNFQTLGWIIGRWYVTEMFPPEAANRASEIGENLKQAWIDIVAESDWMEGFVEAVAIQKLEAMRFRIGGPSEINPVNIRDPQAVLNYYANVSVTRNNHLGNLVSALKSHHANDWASPGDPMPDVGVWDMMPHFVNGYYDNTFNTITLPAADFQPGLFHDEWPAFMNYGALGSMVGHEIGHALDQDGSRYRPDGVEMNWWTDNSTATFRGKMQCFVDQYDEYYIVDGVGRKIYLNGRLEANENMADAAGLKAAYRAYQLHKAQHGESPRLPGMEQWTGDEMFFIAYAYSFCAGYSLAEAQDNIQSDGHALQMFRILGPLENSAYFKEVFQCPAKQPTCEMF